MLYSLHYIFEQYVNLCKMNNETAIKYLIQKFRSLIIACSYENPAHNIAWYGSDEETSVRSTYNYLTVKVLLYHETHWTLQDLHREKIHSFVVEVVKNITVT